MQLIILQASLFACYLFEHDPGLLQQGLDVGNTGAITETMGVETHVAVQGRRRRRRRRRTLRLPTVRLPTLQMPTLQMPTLHKPKTAKETLQSYGFDPKSCWDFLQNIPDPANSGNAAEMKANKDEEARVRAATGQPPAATVPEASVPATEKQNAIQTACTYLVSADDWTPSPTPAPGGRRRAPPKNGVYRCTAFDPKNFIPNFFAKKMGKIDLTFMWCDGIGPLGNGYGTSLGGVVTTEHCPWSIEGHFKWPLDAFSDRSCFWNDFGTPAWPSTAWTCFEGVIRICYTMAFKPFGSGMNLKIPPPISRSTNVELLLAFRGCLTLSIGPQGDLTIELNAGVTVSATVAGKSLTGDGLLTGYVTMFDFNLFGAPLNLFSRSECHVRYDLQLWILEKNFVNYRGNISNTGTWNGAAEYIADAFREVRDKVAAPAKKSIASMFYSRIRGYR